MQSCHQAWLQLLVLSRRRSSSQKQLRVFTWLWLAWQASNAVLARPHLSYVDHDNDNYEHHFRASLKQRDLPWRGAQYKRFTTEGKVDRFWRNSFLGATGGCPTRKIHQSDSE